MVLSKILAKIERMEIYLQISKGEDFHFLGTGTFKFSTEKWIVNKRRIMRADMKEGSIVAEHFISMVARFYILFLLCLIEFSTILGLDEIDAEIGPQRVIRRGGYCNSPVRLVV